MQFAELAVTTNFTFLTGASHPEEIIAHAAELGLDAIAITDRNTLAGVVRAHVRLKELKREQVTLKPRNVTGSDVREHAAKVSAIRSQVRIDPSSRQPDVAPAASTDQARGKVFPHRSGGGAEAVPDEEPEYRSIPKLIIGARLVLSDTPVELIALVTDRAAYGRLCRLLTIGKRRTVKGECDLRLADVAEWAEGLILIAVLPDVLKHDESLSETDILEPVETWQRNSKHALGSARPRVGAKRPPGGAVGRCPAAPDKIVTETVRVIGKLGAHIDHLALTPRYDGLDSARFARLAEIAKARGLTLTATAQPVMHRANRRKLADILTCIREGCTVDTLGRRALPNAEQHLRGPEAMARIWHDYPDALKTAAEIAGQCTFSLDELRYEYPDEGNGETPQDRLARLAAEGLRWRYPEGVPERARALVNRELDLIGKLNYAPYFLTVHDIVAFARSRGILCQGRGSAANSTVCYALGVTEIAPDTISMVFERFVSEARDEPPDIDVDFEHERREEVIQHIYETYGRERAGLTATVIHFRSRAAIREVGKAMGLSEDVTSALSGQVWGWSQEAIREERLREVGLDPTDRRLQQALALVEQIIGFPRHLSQHVGGFVITAGRLDELCPIENAAMDDRTVIEWDKDDIDALGILKVDVLALGMLTCIRKAFDLIASHLGTRYTLATLPPECPEVYDMLCEADSLGVFQVESRAQMNFLPRMRPRNFYDLVIEVAIIRPGPIQGDMVHPYIRGGRAKSRSRSHPTNWARCWARPWACRCSRNRPCASRSSRRASRRTRLTGCAVRWRHSARPAPFPASANASSAGCWNADTSRISQTGASARSKGLVNTAFPKATRPASRCWSMPRHG